MLACMQQNIALRWPEPLTDTSRLQRLNAGPEMFWRDERGRRYVCRYVDRPEIEGMTNDGWELFKHA